MYWKALAAALVAGWLMFAPLGTRGRMAAAGIGIVAAAFCTVAARGDRVRGMVGHAIAEPALQADPLAAALALPEPACCGRCAEHLLALQGCHQGERAARPKEAVERHGRLERIAWRGSHPQEGFRRLFRCRDCGAWWSRSVSVHFPEVDIRREAGASVEAWIAKEPVGGTDDFAPHYP